MKKIYLSLLSFLTAFTVNAQLTQANHAPAAAETFTMYRCDSITTTPGGSGANVLWNYASIVTHSNLVRNYSVQGGTTTAYPDTNIAVGSAANDVAYLSSTTNTLGYYGGNISVGAITGSLTYVLPAIHASFPMSLNTTSTVATSGSLYIPALSQSGTFTGNSSVLVDGSGTISLPNGTFTNTLRVVTSQTLNITTSLANATVTQINYNYYADGIKAPMFSISTSTAQIGGFLPSTTTQTIVSRNKSAALTPTLTVGLNENSLKVNFSVYPNPALTSVNFATDHADAKSVSLYDITGKLIETQNLSEGKTKMDVSSYNKGLYFYTISTGNNKALKSGKITIGQ